MARNMSFFHTTPQFLAQTKDITRRLGWLSLKPGDILNACEKCQGLKKGQKIVKLGPIEIVSVRRERLNRITQSDVIREGFPEMTPVEFIDFFCKAMGVTPRQMVTRIVFRYIERMTFKIDKVIRHSDYSSSGEISLFQHAARHLYTLRLTWPNSGVGWPPGPFCPGAATQALAVEMAARDILLRAFDYDGRELRRWAKELLAPKPQQMSLFPQEIRR